MTELSPRLEGTVNLNDWLNTFAEYSIFGDFESTEEFADIIDQVLEDLENEFTLEIIEEMRQSGQYSDAAIDAIEELFIQLVEDEFQMDYRLLSPKYEDRYWIFTRDEFTVKQVSIYQITEGIDFQIIGEAGGDIDEIEQHLPEEFENYDYIGVRQTGTHDDEVLSMDEWREMVEYDRRAEFRHDDGQYGKDQLRNQCIKNMERYPDAAGSRKCYKMFGGNYNANVMAHMVAWPLVIFILLIFVLIIRSIRSRRRQADSDETPVSEKPQMFENEKPPQYNFVIQFPPDYNDAVKTPEQTKTEA